MRLLISGYYGFGNLGDEALLEVIVAQLRTRHPLLEIEVLAAEPALTEHALRVSATLRSDPSAVRRAIARADVVVSGGGGLLQNATSLRSLFYYAGILRTAIRSGRKAMTFAQSIGPLDFIGRRVVAEFCRGVSAATVRDARSARLLRSLLPGVDVRLTADPVFLYDPPVLQQSALAELGLGPASDPLVVVCVRGSRAFGDVATVVAEAADRLALEHGARIAFVPFGGAADADAATVVMRKCRCRPTLIPAGDLGTVAAIIAQARLVIGMRLHSLILAVRAGVPFLAVAYDPKVLGLCEDIGYPLEPLWSCEGREHAASPAAELADDAWQRRDELARVVGGASARMRALAAENFNVLDGLIA